jgi:hypothetical protein
MVASCQLRFPKFRPRNHLHAPTEVFFLLAYCTSLRILRRGAHDFPSIINTIGAPPRERIPKYTNFRRGTNGSDSWLADISEGYDWCDFSTRSTILLASATASAIAATAAGLFCGTARNLRAAKIFVRQELFSNLYPLCRQNLSATRNLLLIFLPL